MGIARNGVYWRNQTVSIHSTRERVEAVISGTVATQFPNTIAWAAVPSIVATLQYIVDCIANTIPTPTLFLAHQLVPCLLFWIVASGNGLSRVHIVGGEQHCCEKLLTYGKWALEWLWKAPLVCGRRYQSLLLAWHHTHTGKTKILYIPCTLEACRTAPSSHHRRAACSTLRRSTEENGSCQQ